MCDDCKPIEEKRERYRQVKILIRDQQTRDGIERLLGELAAQIKALHPEPE